ncbi:MAG: hypothetical protein HQL66_06555 [Magnetococcales bacterium]|nr:hypothetical protein [Magnetococcales bacterium]
MVTKPSGLELKETKLVIVEGRSDQCLIQHLMDHHEISGIQVLCPGDLNEQFGGVEAIVKLLGALKLNREFHQVQGILLLIDADEKPGDQFTKIRSLLQNAPGGWPVPDKLGQPARKEGIPAVTVHLLPDNETPGAMETLLWNAAVKVADRQKLVECIETFEQCIHAYHGEQRHDEKWLPQKRDKLKFRCLISAVNPKNPDLPTTRLWEGEETRALVPLDSPVFDSLVNVLQGMLVNPAKA